MYAKVSVHATSKVTQWGTHEYLGARDAGLADALANLLFVPIRPELCVS